MTSIVLFLQSQQILRDAASRLMNRAKRDLKFKSDQSMKIFPENNR